MKKIALAFIVIFTTVLVMSSCKAHSSCPAYSQVNHQVENTVNS